jgi:hypothetical protein
MKNLVSTSITALIIVILCAFNLLAAVPSKTEDLKSYEDQYFMLPEGISVASLHGPDKGCATEAKVKSQIVGSGGNIRICMTFENSTSENMLVDLPAGLTFLSGNATEEKGILLQKVTVMVPAKGVQKVLLHAYCFNLDREYTRGPQDLYQFGSVLNHPTLTEVFEMAKDIKIDENKSKTKEQDDRLRYITTTLQDAIFQVLKDGRLGDDSKERIFALK